MQDCIGLAEYLHISNRDQPVLTHSLFFTANVTPVSLQMDADDPEITWAFLKSRCGKRLATQIAIPQALQSIRQCSGILLGMRLGSYTGYPGRPVELLVLLAEEEGLIFKRITLATFLFPDVFTTCDRHAQWEGPDSGSEDEYASVTWLTDMTSPTREIHKEDTPDDVLCKLEAEIEFEERDIELC
jgi:hypothetical protein